MTPADQVNLLNSLKHIHTAVGKSCPLVLHGTHPLSDDMVRLAMKLGVVKINENRTVRNRYMEFLAGNSGKMELTQLQMEGVEIYSQEIERMMRDVFMSAGRA